MNRLIKLGDLSEEKQKRIKKIEESMAFAQNFTIKFQNTYNEMVALEPKVRSLLDIQAVQIYQIMLEKLKKGLVAFNKSTITDKLNFIIQNIMQDNEQFNQNYNASPINTNRLIKKSKTEDTPIIKEAKQLKKDLLRIKKELFDLYDDGEILAEMTKQLLNYHAKNSVLKRIKNIKTVARWLNNDDAFDTDLIGRLDKIIDGEIPNTVE